MTVTVPECRCLRCGHRWIARSARLPVCCAACKSPRWDRPARWRRTRPRPAGGEAPPKTDPVVQAYKKGIDRTLIRENLRRSVEERFRNLEELGSFASELRRAVRQERSR